MKIIYIKLLTLAMYSILFFGCKPEDDLGQPDRLFRPILKSVTEGGNWIKVSWDRYSGTTNFELELSVDSFKTLLKSVSTEETEYTFDNSVIEYDKYYQIRIKGKGENIESGFYENLDIKTSDVSTLLIAPTTDDILDNAIRIRWETSSAGYVYTLIRVFIGDVLVKIIPLTATDNAAKQRIISGLNPETNYQIKIYEGETYRGKKVAETKASPEYTGQIIDLRGLQKSDAFSWFTQAKFDSITANFPAGATIILDGGIEYGIPSLSIGCNLTIVTGMSFAGKATLRFNGAFNIAANAIIQKIKFENVFCTEGTEVGKKKTDANFGGQYIFNISNASNVVDEIVIADCDIRYKRGVMRTQGGAATSQYKKILISGCVVDSIGGYGLINNDVAGCKIGDVIFNNSTLANSYMAFVATKSSYNSLTVDKCTFCYIGDISSTTVRYIFNFTGQTLVGGLMVSNSVFGASWNGVQLHGYRANSGTAASFANSYKTKDLTWALDLVTGVPAYPIDAFVDLGKTTFETFQDPLKLNFKVTDSRLVNIAGDPRWW